MLLITGMQYGQRSSRIPWAVSQEAVVVAYHAMMARLQITFAKQQALLSSMAAPPSTGSDGQRDHMVVSKRGSADWT